MKLSELPSNLKAEVLDFIDYLNFEYKNTGRNNTKRIAEKAKGLIKMNLMLQLRDSKPTLNALFNRYHRFNLVCY